MKTGPHTEADLRLLDDYRKSFGEAYEAVVGTIRKHGEAPTGKAGQIHAIDSGETPCESIRLSQMQDIAGCRVVVVNVVLQEQFVATLAIDFPGASVIDRREKPSYGYRAVHVIVDISGRPVEIQVRSSLQHLWAEVSEKSSDVLDPTIKHGGGSESWRDFLTSVSELITSFEEMEKKGFQNAANWEVYVAALEKEKKSLAELPEHHIEVQKLRDMLAEEARAMDRGERDEQKMREERIRQWNVLAGVLANAISQLETLKGQKQ